MKYMEHWPRVSACCADQNNLFGHKKQLFKEIWTKVKLGVENENKIKIDGFSLNHYR